MYKDKSIEFIKVQTIFSLDSDRNKKKFTNKELRKLIVGREIAEEI